MKIRLLSIVLILLSLGSLLMGPFHILIIPQGSNGNPKDNLSGPTQPTTINSIPKMKLTYNQSYVDFTNPTPIPVNTELDTHLTKIYQTTYPTYSIYLLKGYYLNLTTFSTNWSYKYTDAGGNITNYVVDIDIAVFFSNKTSWKNASSNNVNEVISSQIPVTDTYYLAVYPYESAIIKYGTVLESYLINGNTNTYNITKYGQFSVDITPVVSSVRVQEVDLGTYSFGNNVNLTTASNATNILPHLPELHPGQTTWLWEHNRFGLTSNDLYKVKIPANTTFNIYVDYLTSQISNPDPTNYYLTVIDYNNFVAHGSKIGTYQKNGSNILPTDPKSGLKYLSSSQIINNVTAADSDTYYIIRIYGPSLNVVTFQYNITIKVIDYIDAYTSNNAASSAFPTSKLLNFILFTNSADEDFFVVTPPSQPLRLTVDVFFDRNFGKINLYVYNKTLMTIPRDDSKSLVGKSDFSDQNQQEVIYNIFTTDVIYIKVNSSAQYSNGYTLNITLGAIDDQYEPNNGFFQPATLYKTGSDNQYNLFIAKNDYDFFRIFLYKDDKLNITIYFDGSQADVNLFLYSDQFTPLDQSIQATSNNESVATTATKNGYYYFVVYGKSATFILPGINYNMILTVIAQDDYLEPNNNKDQTAPVQDGLFHLISRAGNEDWFTVYMRSSDQFTVSVGFDTSKGDIDIFLFDSKASIMYASSQSFTNNESLSFTAPSEGNYLLRVALFDGQSVNYDMNITLTDERYDPYEDNDNFQQAFTLQPGSYTGIIAQGGDHDFFRVSIPSGYGVIVELLEETPGTGKNFRLVLYSSQQVEINRSERNLNSQYISPVAVKTATDVYVEAYYKGFGKVTYALNITIALNSVLFPPPKIILATIIPSFSINTSISTTTSPPLYNLGTILAIGLVGLGGGAAAGVGGTVISQKANLGSKIKSKIIKKK